jgi:serine/threonine protein phosphatase PrpC
MARGSHHRNRCTGVNPGGSEVNGFPERLLLATDGLENTALAALTAVDLAKKGDAKESTSERGNHEACAP